jgi:hypothetical protein
MRQDRPILMLDHPDGLRLVGLGRIPRCTECPRYAALVAVYLERRNGGTTARRLPAAPASCGFQACAPLAKRYGAPIPIHAPSPRVAGPTVLAS